MLDRSLQNIFPGIPAHIGSIDITYKKQVDANLVSTIINFIRSALDDLAILGLNKVTVGLSGGVDSTVICALLKEAVEQKAFAVIVDFEQGKDYSSDTKFSIEIAEKIGINYRVVKAYELFYAHLAITRNNSLLTHLHLRSRLINNIIFQVADNEMAAIIDSTDKSEKLLGRHAESFMGHVAPIVDLYKSELYDMLDYFALGEVKKKESGCPELLDRDAFGVEWEVLDKVLYLLAYKNMPPEEIARKYNVDVNWLQKLEKRIQKHHFRTETKKLLLGVR